MSVVDRGVIATANELFDAGHFPGVVALVSSALEAELECVPLLVLRARAHIALRRDLDAQADLRDIIRLDPQCALAYRLLGEVAARRSEHESAAIFFREAIRLNPKDQIARERLAAVDAAPSPVRIARAGSQPRFARGTHPPDETLEQPTARTLEEGRRTQERFARGSDPNPAWRTPAPRPIRHLTPTPGPLPLPPAPPMTTLAGIPRPTAPALPAPHRYASRPMRAQTIELPGFGDYLVASGILTRERLRAAHAYQRSMKVQLSTAIVTLGLATPQRIEWAAVKHQSHVGQLDR